MISRWEFTQDGRDFTVRVDGRLVVDDATTMIDAALRGSGLAYVMKSQVKEHLASKRLIRVLTRYCVPFPGLYLYYPSRAHIPPKVQAFVEFFKPR